jgi:hypothetical protein
MRCSAERAQKSWSISQVVEKLVCKLLALQLPLHTPACALICVFRPGVRCRWLVRNDPLGEGKISFLGCHGSLQPPSQVSALHVWPGCACLDSGDAFWDAALCF